MINRTPKETQQDLLDEVVLRELANRSPEIAPLITDASHYLASPPKKGELLTLRPEEYAPAHAKAPPVAVYLDAKKSVQCVPLDPLVISYYRLPLIQEDLESLGLRYPFGPDFTMCRQLRLVDKLSGIPSEINTAQLIALQSLLGNLSTWWPITAYSSEDLRTIFSTLDLGVLYHHSRPVGVAHLDFSHGASDEAKVVFMAVDPKLHGNRLGAALLVQTLSYAYQKGVRCIYLDTVPHRDIGYSKGSSIETMPVSGFYEKFGFQLIRSEMIDPGSPPPGVEINQLNAPLGYQLDDSELRRMIDETFPLPL